MQYLLQGLGQIQAVEEENMEVRINPNHNERSNRISAPDTQKMIQRGNNDFHFLEGRCLHFTNILLFAQDTLTLTELSMGLLYKVTRNAVDPNLIRSLWSLLLS